MGEPLNPSSQMEPPPSPARSNLPMLYFGLVVVGTAALVLVLYNLVIVRWYTDITNQQLQQRVRRSHGSTSSQRTLNFDINFVSSFKYKRDGDGDGDSECIVCLSVFEEGEEIKQLPKCKHYFHAPCIDMWLYSHMDCPICRSRVLRHHAATEQLEEQLEHSREGLLDPGMLV